jgi:hypothetical protein
MPRRVGLVTASVRLMTFVTAWRELQMQLQLHLSLAGYRFQSAPPPCKIFTALERERVTASALAPGSA